jgi:hypothetical protein
MNINTISLIGFTVLFSYIVYSSLKPKVSPFVPQRSGLLVAQDTGKTHYNQSKTGDVSLAIERIRRQTIQDHGRDHKYKLKETRTQKGSVTGAMETHMISRIRPYVTPACNSYDILFDGGSPTDEYCEYVSDGYLDAGDNSTKACGL